MSIQISEQQVKAYERDGAIVLRQVIDRRWIEKLREGLETLLANPQWIYEEYDPESKVPGKGRFVNAVYMHKNIPPFMDFAKEGPCPEIAARLMRSKEVRFFLDQTLIKEGGTRRPTYWHQDKIVNAIDGRQNCTTWIPLDPVPLRSAVEYVRGSHHWNVTYAYFNSLKERKKYAGTQPPAPDIDGHRDSFKVLSWSTKPGDVVVFPDTTLHQGKADIDLNERRRILIFRWIGDDATYSLREPAAEYPLALPPGIQHGDSFSKFEQDFPRLWPRERRERSVAQFHRVSA